MTDTMHNEAVLQLACRDVIGPRFAPVLAAFLTGAYDAAWVEQVLVDLLADPLTLPGDWCDAAWLVGWCWESAEIQAGIVVAMRSLLGDRTTIALAARAAAAAN